MSRIKTNSHLLKMEMFPVHLNRHLSSIFQIEKCENLQSLQIAVELQRLSDLVVVMASKANIRPYLSNFPNADNYIYKSAPEHLIKINSCCESLQLSTIKKQN